MADDHVNLVEFLRARLDEDEQAAREAHYEGQRWISEEEDVCRWPDDELVHIADRKRDAAHIARHDPARVLAEVEAKRQMVDLAAGMLAAAKGDSEVDHYGGLSAAEETLLLLARPFRDHPDFDSSWLEG